MSERFEIRPESTSFAGVSPVRGSARPAPAGDSRMSVVDSGSSTAVSSERSAPGSSSLKTSRAGRSSGSRKSKRISKPLDTELVPSHYLPLTSEHRTSDGESSLLPTLTANLLAPSMQKWAAHRRLLPTLTSSSYGYNKGGAAGRVGEPRPSLNTLAGGPLNPQWCEWFMGFPEGWTDVDEKP